jgi:dihydroorotate dehydrogenase electron transfer subunit
METPSSKDITAEVIENVEVGPGIFRLSLDAPQICCQAAPGQFAMIRVNSSQKSTDPLLRRPLSIHNISRDNVQFLYKVLGRGTEMLTVAKPGDRVTVLAPLGNGYSINKAKPACLVGGGMGIAPLLFLAEVMDKAQYIERFAVLLGARNKSELLAVESFKKLSKADIKIATDDGSSGHSGFVTELLSEMNDQEKKLNVYCCGPEPMMQKVASVCAQRQWGCQVSLEAIMACGMGACLGCAVNKKHILDQDGYLHVCSDGPVFEAERIW